MSKLKEYVREKHFHESRYVKISVATSSKTGEKVVIKEMTIMPDTGYTNDQINKMIRRERTLTEAAQKSNNPNIVKLTDSFEESNKVYLVMKYYEAGDLGKYLIAKGGTLPEKRALEIFKKICQGYTWLVVNGVVHRDLKLQNIFMDGDEPVISDFGSARFIQEENSVGMSDVPFSGYNLSPQQINGQPYGTDADIWGLGLILYELIYGVHPFGQKGHRDMIPNILHKDFSFIDTIIITVECRKLIECMLFKERERRIDWKTLIQHPLINPEKKPPEPRNLIKVISIEFGGEKKNPKIPKEQLIALYNSTITLNKAITAIKTCQQLVSQSLKKIFIPFSTFSIAIYGLLKIGIINLRLALSYTTDSDSEFKDIFKRCRTTKEKLEKMFFSLDFLDLLNEIPELTEDLKKMFNPLTNNIRSDYEWCIEPFRKWLNDKSGQLIMNAIWQYRNELNTTAGEASKCIFDVLAILKEDLIKKFLPENNEESPQSTRRKTKIKFLEE